MKSSTGTDALFVNVEASKSLDRAIQERHFDRLLAANGPALTRLAASYTNTAADRDDLLQEIALAIWQAWPRFRGECSERTFLFRIAHNRAIAHLARSRSQMPRSQMPRSQMPRSQMQGSAEEIDVHDPAPDPESGLAQEQQAERLRRAVHRLPVAYRQVVTLTLEGLAYGEIADVLGISESNVGVRLTRARRILQELLK
jgi:RNA polymerase sigma factor (sigma-70 family)